jgi:ABC-type lipoprotein release transport system permease subunit
VGRVVLVLRLAVRDVRRRPVEAALLLVAIMAATTTLSLGLVLRQAAGDPYRETRQATAGPDVVASVGPAPKGNNGSQQPADVAGLTALADAHGVVAHSGPYPVARTTAKAHGHTVAVEAEGRDTTAARVDQPKLVHGTWVRPGAVVVEAALADALGVGPGDQITIAGHRFRVGGVAVTAAMLPYPEAFDYGIEPTMGQVSDRGLVWLTTSDARRLSAAADLSYVLNLKLADPTAAMQFVSDLEPDPSGPPPTSGARSTPMLMLEPWQVTRDNASILARNAQRVLVTGGSLLGLLAVASVAVLVGGRMADQTRRVGLLKAVGGTPGLVAAVLLAEHVGVALLAAAAGLALGWLVAPMIAQPTAGLIGSAGAPPLTIAIVGVVVAVAVGVAAVATLVPAVRAARTSTVVALADAARPPRRTAWLIAVSARLPAPLLLALRVAGRRPRRLVLAVVSLAVAVTGLVAALALKAQLATSNFATSAALNHARTERLGDVLMLISVMLVALAAVNTIVITWATVLDARHASALARALGVTPQQVTAALSTAQLLPALVGTLLGIPGGLALVAAVDPDSTTNPPVWQLLAVVPVTALVVAGLTAIPALIGARRPPAPVLQAEHA